MASVISSLLTYPPLWDTIQSVAGDPASKAAAYRAVLTPPARILDFGCSTGHLADAFREFDYTGIDLDQRSITYAAKTRKHGRFICADLRTRPFPENHFDSAIMGCTVHHLPDGLLVDLLREIRYCLKPGGVLHVFDPVRQSSDGWRQRLFRRLDRGPYARTYPEIRAAIAQAGGFAVGPSVIRPYHGLIMRDCDSIYLPLTKA